MVMLGYNLRIILFYVFTKACLGHEQRCSKFAFEEDLLAKMVRMEYKMELATEKIEKTEKQIEARQVAFESEKAKLLKEFNILKDTLGEGQRKQNEIIEQRMQANVDEMTRLSTELRVLLNTSMTDRIDQVYMSQVMFRTKDTSGSSIKAGDTFVFTDVIENTGDGYDVSSGVFTAPLEGVYIFSAQICTIIRMWLSFQIIADDKVLSALAHGDQDYTPTCVTATTVVRLQVGSKVHVKCAGAYSGSILSNFKDSGWNTFWGVRIP